MTSTALLNRYAFFVFVLSFIPITAFSSSATGGDDCQFEAFFFTNIECLSDSTYSTTIDAVINGSDSDILLLELNGIFLGSIPLDSLPYTIENIPLSLIEFDYLQAQVEGETDCFAGLDIPIPSCENSGDCLVSGLEVFDIECETDSTYSFTFSAEVEGGDFVDVYINNEFVDYIAVADLPYTVTGITPRINSEEDIIQICVNDAPECCFVLEWPQPDCSDNADCGFYEIFAEAYDCEEGQFFLDFDFDMGTQQSDSFFVVINTDLNYSFPYGENFYTVGPFEGNGQVLNLLFLDGDDFECEASISFEAPNCQEDCELSDLYVEDLDCNSDSLTYALTFNLDLDGGEIEFLDVWVNNEFVGYFSIAELPITIDSVTPREDSTEDVLQVCQNDNPNCCIEVEWTQPDCFVGIQELGKLEIGLFPNPTAGNIQLTGLTDGIVYELTIADLTGRQVKNNSLRAGENLDLSELATGSYTIRIHQNGELVGSKMLIRK